MENIKSCTNKKTGEIFDYIKIDEKNNINLGIVLRSCKEEKIQAPYEYAIGNDTSWGVVPKEYFTSEFIIND